MNPPNEICLKHVKMVYKNEYRLYLCTLRHFHYYYGHTSHIHTFITITHSLYHSTSTKNHPHLFISSLEDKCTIFCSICNHSSCKALLNKDKLEEELSALNDSLGNSNMWNQLICFSGYFFIWNPLIILEIKCLHLHKCAGHGPKGLNAYTRHGITGWLASTAIFARYL